MNRDEQLIRSDLQFGVFHYVSGYRSGSDWFQF